MANSIYAKARTAFFSGEIDLLDDDINAALVSGSYTPNLLTDEFFSTVSAFVVGTPVLLTGNAIDDTGGDAIFDADDAGFSTVTGDEIVYAVIYKDTGVEATSRLIALIDTATGLPVAPVGVNITIQWSADGIFSWLGC